MWHETLFIVLTKVQLETKTYQINIVRKLQPRFRPWFELDFKCESTLRHSIIKKAKTMTSVTFTFIFKVASPENVVRVPVRVPLPVWRKR